MTLCAKVDRHDAGLRWCFGCRKRLPHALVVYAPADEWSYYGPHAQFECSGCGRDRSVFPGRTREGVDEWTT